MLFRTEFKARKASYRATKFPIVLCHGLLGFDQLKLGSFTYQYWNGLQQVLEEHGAMVLSDSVPPLGSIEARAHALRAMILDQKDGFEQVNLIGHSMGGLDARYMVAKLSAPNFKVKSVTTIATPHQGTFLADLALPVTRQLPGTMGAFAELATGRMKEFNESIKNDPDIHYMSYGAQFVPSWASPLLTPWKVLYSKEGPNDGLVSVKSAAWGDYKGTVDRADHLDVINLSQYKRKSRNHDFDAGAMYLHIMDELAGMGL